MFVALLHAVLDPREKTLKLYKARQTQPIILSGEGSKPLLIDTEGDRFPLGIVDDCHYEETKVQLTEGDVVILYTDGVVEALNSEGEMYGFEKLMASIEEGSNLNENSLLEKLMDDVSRFVGSAEQHDDLTIVVVKVE
jgi:sigma-B regulation protein RsbU (phosphoserine phosphatase)